MGFRVGGLVCSGLEFWVLGQGVFLGGLKFARGSTFGCRSEVCLGFRACAALSWKAQGKGFVCDCVGLRVSSAIQGKGASLTMIKP